MTPIAAVAAITCASDIASFPSPVFNSPLLAMPVPVPPSPPLPGLPISPTSLPLLPLPPLPLPEIASSLHPVFRGC
ncbi:hypothetical protein LC613_32005 [Nostoc sphaeroides CHAB 2801]|uniref:hypothetical protein n=1 Tax=Nostoc sphaeroides TaxID=446679 RepID=UPI001E39F9DC|nr:hypothetical protein [Nostoc sphaeroides]MCC5632267.1 hypothetical protein [Nostoc sphaeroides CHAB 2801]